MLTLSYGYLKPQTPDNGGDFFPALEQDIQQLNDHTHNGSNSALLTSQSITPVSQTILTASWSATSGGTYRQLVTTPPAIDFDNYGLAFRIASGANLGFEIHPSVERVTDTTFYVYTNDNTIDVTILYLV